MDDDTISTNDDQESSRSISPVPNKTKKQSKQLVKKGPGRPRKTPKKEPTPRRGIVSSPTIENAIIEMSYDMPVIFKKIVAFFKSLACQEIQIVFRPTEIIMYSVDHHKKSKIRIKVDASKLNHYYCKTQLDIGINCGDLERVMNKIDKDYSKINIMSTIQNSQKNIVIIIENDLQIDEHHVIDLIGSYTKVENEEQFINEDYAINFTLPGRYFRKMITDIKNMSGQMSIIQDGPEEFLKFGYISTNRKIQTNHIVTNTDKIKLVSKLTESDTFRVDLMISNIKPISSAHIAEEITILVDEGKALMTKALIDNNTIEIKTLTEIIDKRRPVM
jgi:hypothetical protein